MRFQNLIHQPLLEYKFNQLIEGSIPNSSLQVDDRLNIDREFWSQVIYKAYTFERRLPCKHFTFGPVLALSWQFEWSKLGSLYWAHLAVHTGIAADVTISPSFPQSHHLYTSPQLSTDIRALWSTDALVKIEMGLFYQFISSHRFHIQTNW